MQTFPLEIVTLDGEMFRGEVARVSCRTIHGNLAILARHCNYCTAIGMGEGKVVMADGTQRTAACIGGMLTVMNGACKLLPTTWEWSDEIDVARATEAKMRAEQKLGEPNISKADQKLWESELRRALVRLSVAQNTSLH